MKVQIERELTSQDILDISVTALEGGIGYWAVAKDIDLPEWLADTGMYDDRVLFRIQDREPVQPYQWFDVTPEVIARGIGLVMKGVRYDEKAPRMLEGMWNFEPRQFVPN
jgi:hypothetical protein